MSSTTTDPKLSKDMGAGILINQWIMFKTILFLQVAPPILIKSLFSTHSTQMKKPREILFQRDMMIHQRFESLWMWILLDP
jgi:hypothetical protein